MRSASFGLFLLLGLVACVSGWTASSYRAGVVEYMPFVPQRFNVSHEVALAIMHRNINEYEKFMIEARAEGVDILVFPEYGLYGPSFPTRASVYPFLESIPSAGANPCLEHDLYPYLNVTYRLSCLARQHQIVLAVDMGDVQPCTKWDYDCPADRRYQFNTLVVFDVDGVILTKYHKTNLYFEPEFDVPVNQSPVHFELFGTRFGTIICFDIMFAKPQIEMLKKFGVTEVLFSSWWVNTPPILTATQIQQGWSRAFDLNLLASNSGYNRRVSGSGIYSKGVALASFTNPTMTSQNRLLIADVQKIPSKRPQPNTPQLKNAVRIPKETLLEPKPLSIHSKILRTWDVTPTTLVDTVEIDSISCTFSYQMAKPFGSLPNKTSGSTPLDAPPKNASLVLYAASGYLTPLFPALACGVASCPTDDVAQCITLLQRSGQTLISGDAAFSFFSLKALLKDPENKFTVYPVSAKNEGVLYTEEELTYNRQSQKGVHLLTTPRTLHKGNKPVSLLHVGFLVRNLELAM